MPSSEPLREDEQPVLVGTVIKVIDGDTIKVQLSSGPINVRFDSIDAPQGRALLDSLHGAAALPMSCHLLMDCAYEGDQTRQLALDLGLIPVVPPHPNRTDPWTVQKALYRRRNEVERLFRRLKGFRRIFSRFEKLDLVFIAFIYFALIVEALRELV